MPALQPCPPIDLEFLLGLEEKRKMIRMMPKGGRSSFISIDDVPRRSVVEDNRIVDFLRSEGFTLGLVRTLMKNTDSFPVRIWLVDNGSSMNAADGHRVVTTANKIESVNCTRWEELTSTILWHAHFCNLMLAPTAIRFVNPSPAMPQQLEVAATTGIKVDVETEVQRLKLVLQATPHGNGTLMTHFQEIITTVSTARVDALDGRSMAIILVTDRLPTDEQGNDASKQFIKLLHKLEGIPCWIVIRLSTDEKDVVEFYGNLDNKMITVERAASIHLDVLDDYVSEAAAVQEHNPWLNYAYPLHLCRESGVNFPVFDILNDRPLVHEELQDFVALLFDRQINNQTAWNEQPIPNPLTQYAKFREEIMELNKKNGGLYNPIRKRVMPWVDIRELDRVYGSDASILCKCSIL